MDFPWPCFLQSLGFSISCLPTHLVARWKLKSCSKMVPGNSGSDRIHGPLSKTLSDLSAVLPNSFLYYYNSMHSILFPLPTTGKLRRKPGSWEPPRYCFASKETTWGFQRMRDGPLAIKKPPVARYLYIYMLCICISNWAPHSQWLLPKKNILPKLTELETVQAFEMPWVVWLGMIFASLSHQISIDFQGFVAYGGVP